MNDRFMSLIPLYHDPYGLFNGLWKCQGNAANIELTLNCEVGIPAYSAGNSGSAYCIPFTADILADCPMQLSPRNSPTTHETELVPYDELGLQRMDKDVNGPNASEPPSYMAPEPQDVHAAAERGDVESLKVSEHEPSMAEIARMASHRSGCMKCTLAGP